MATKSKKSTKTSSKGKSAGSGKRTLISPKGDKRYVRRDAMGRFTSSDDQSRSLSKDVKKAAKTKVKSGYGDRGDQPRKTSAKAKK